MPNKDPLEMRAELQKVAELNDNLQLDVENLE